MLIETLSVFPEMFEPVMSTSVSYTHLTLPTKA